jgi:hypothetical protein
MPIIDAFPGAPDVVDSVELRKNLAGLIVRDTAGNPRPGIFPRHLNPLVTSTNTTSPMTVNVAAFEGASVRGGGPLFMANDGTTAVTIPTAPGSNSRIDVLIFRQRENGYLGFADVGGSGPVIEVVSGNAAASPVKPSLAAYPGAVELATVLVTAGNTMTSQMTITPTHQFTATSGGTVVVRNDTEMNAWTPAAGAEVWHIANDATYRRRGTAWVRVSPVLAKQSSGASISGVTIPAGAIPLGAPPIFQTGFVHGFSTIAFGNGYMATVTFATPFPTGVLHVSVTPIVAGGALSAVWAIDQMSNTGFRVFYPGAASETERAFTWMAIGYGT